MTMPVYSLSEPPNATNSVEANARDNLFVPADNSHTANEESEDLVSTREEWAALFSSERKSASTTVLKDFIQAVQQLTVSKDALSEFSRVFRSAFLIASKTLLELQEVSDDSNTSFYGAWANSEVDDFIRTNQLVRPFERMLELISNHFADSEIKNISVEFDAQTCERWVNIVTRVYTPPREAAEIDTKLLMEWVIETSLEKTDLVRVSYIFK